MDKAERMFLIAVKAENEGLDSLAARALEMALTEEFIYNARDWYLHQFVYTK